MQSLFFFLPLTGVGSKYAVLNLEKAPLLSIGDGRDVSERIGSCNDFAMLLLPRPTETNEFIIRDEDSILF